MPEDSSIVYLNGEFLPIAQACVPVLDRGFVFGDGVYEVIPAYGGRLFRLQEHLARLERSLSGVRLASPLSHTRWETLLNELVERNAARAGANKDQSVYLQVTRGVAKRDLAFPEVPATVFAMSDPLPQLSRKLLAQGVSAITLEDIRWKYCEIKAITLLPNSLLRQQALDQGANDAILIRDREVTEGAASNVFIVRDQILITPPKSPHLLPGITRDLVLELAAKHGMPFREEVFKEVGLSTADEIWLTSSTREILPVTRLNRQPVGSGVPGPVWARMMSLFRDYKQVLRSGGDA